MSWVNWTTLWNKTVADVTGRISSVHKFLARQRPKRRLRLAETLSLGEKRFLAIVQFQHQEFLVGGTGQSIALLAKLNVCADRQGCVDGMREDGV